MEIRPLASIRCNDDNPRILKDARFKQLVKSLREDPEFLEQRPIIVDENGIILGGNMRYRALLELGVTEAPVREVTGWTDDKKRRFIIKDNGSYGEFDWDALANGDWPDAATLNDWGVEVPPDWAEIEPEILGEIGLPDGAKPGFGQMTFTLSDLQQQEVETALRLAKAEAVDNFEGTGNENSNGNALAAIVAEYLSARNG